MQNEALEEKGVTPLAPSITWLNWSGDVTITWDENSRESIEHLVEQKMAEGYSFFILKPRMLSFLGDKRIKVKGLGDLKQAKGLVLTDEQVRNLAESVGDPEVAQVLAKSQATLVKAPEGTQQTVRRATTVREITQHQTIAVRPIAGG